MVACCKKERVVSETKCKNFSAEFKAKVTIEGMCDIKMVNDLGQKFGRIPHRLVRNFPWAMVFDGAVLQEAGADYPHVCAVYFPLFLYIRGMASYVCDFLQVTLHFDFRQFPVGLGQFQLNCGQRALCLADIAQLPCLRGL